MKYTEQDVAELVEAVKFGLTNKTPKDRKRVEDALEKFKPKSEWMKLPSTANVWYLKPQGRLMDIGYVTIGSSQYVCFNEMYSVVAKTDAIAREWCERQLES